MWELFEQRFLKPKGKEFCIVSGHSQSLHPAMQFPTSLDSVSEPDVHMCWSQEALQVLSISQSQAQFPPSPFIYGSIP